MCIAYNENTTSRINNYGCVHFGVCHSAVHTTCVRFLFFIISLFSFVFIIFLSRHRLDSFLFSHLPSCRAVMSFVLSNMACGTCAAAATCARACVPAFSNRMCVSCSVNNRYFYVEPKFIFLRC